MDNELSIVRCQRYKLGQFAMPYTRENGLGLVDSCVYYGRQTRESYQALICSVDFKVLKELSE